MGLSLKRLSGAAFIFSTVSILLAGPLYAQVLNGRINISDGRKAYKLTGNWKFKAADDPRFAALDLDDSAWKTMVVPGHWHFRGYNYNGPAWYRLRFRIGPELHDRVLALSTPYTSTAHEIFVNGRLIGGAGRISATGLLLEPGVRTQVHHIPSALLKDENVLALRVRSKGFVGGILSPEIRLGEAEAVEAGYSRYQLLMAVFAAVAVFAGLYHLVIYLGSRNDPAYFFFALLSISLAAFVFSFSTLSNRIWDNYWLNYFLQHVAVTTMPLWSIRFFHSFYGLEPGRTVAAGTVFSILFFVCALAGPWHEYLYGLYIRYIFTGGLIITALLMLSYNYIILRAVRHRKMGARTVAIGTVILSITMVNDVLNYLGLLGTGFIVQWGFLFLVSTMAVAMSAKLLRINRHLEHLTENLQTEVALQTGELKEREHQLENQMQRVRRDMHLARRIQERLLPEQLPTASGVEFSALYQPMEEVGGDFYDFVVMNDRVGIFLCDVSGHGVPAAFIASMIKMSFSELAPNQPDPARFLANLNHAIQGKLAGNFVSAFYGILDFRLKKLTYSCAGHAPALLVRPREIHRLGAKGNVLGPFTGRDYEKREVNLAAGDRVLLYTDGITESMNPRREMYGESNLQESLRRHRALDGNAYLRRLLAEISSYTETTEPHDDITALVLDMH